MNMVKNLKYRFGLTNISAWPFIWLIFFGTNFAHADAGWYTNSGVDTPAAYRGSPQSACDYVSIGRSGTVVPYRIAWVLDKGVASGIYTPGFDVAGPPIPNPENNYAVPGDPQMYCIFHENVAYMLLYSPDRNPQKKIVAIDPGHGGTKCASKGTKTGGDTGTTGPTYKDTEHALALSIGLSLRDKLVSKGYKVVMTRTTAVCPPLEDRVNIATIAKADLFVSIHFNGVDNPKTNGTEVFGLPKVPMSWQLATSSSALLSSTLGTVDRGPKTKSLFVIREATMPAILAEVAFLTNVGGDENIMHRPVSPDDAASAIFSGINQLFNK